MLCRQHRHDQVANITSGCSGCVALTTGCRVLQRRVEMLQRQLRATANLQALLAAKDCELIDCRARLERYEGPRTTTCCDPDVDEDAEATTPVQEHHSSKYRSKCIYL